MIDKKDAASWRKERLFYEVCSIFPNSYCFAISGLKK